MRTVAMVLPPGLSASFYVDDIPHGYTGLIIGNAATVGYQAFDLSDLTVTRVTALAAGFRPYAAEAVVVPPGNFQFRLGVPADPSRPQDVILPGLVPLAPPMPHLEQRGNDFINADGQRIVYPAIDAFFAFRLYRDGGPDALRPFLDESNRYGFTAWRMWSQASKAQSGVYDLSPREAGYYDDVRPCTDLINAAGIVPLWTAFVDNQDVQSPVSHWTALADRLAGSASLLSGFNQWSKNLSNFDPWALPDPGHGLIWSRGSDIDDVQTPPHGAPASELHATRISFDRALMDATASPPNMRLNGSGMVWMTEGQPFGDSAGYSEQQAWQLGRAYSILWALAVFHNRQSQRAQLMEEATARCAAAWVQGMRL